MSGSPATERDWSQMRLGLIQETMGVVGPLTLTLILWVMRTVKGLVSLLVATTGAYSVPE